MATVKGNAVGQGRRARQAAETRRRILAAARSEFVGNGYAATTVQRIAEVADVAWQTVYSVFGTKATILKELFDVTVVGDDLPVPMVERPFVREIAAAPDPREKARIFAAHLRETLTRTAEVVSVIEAAAAGDKEIAGVWQTLQEQRRFGMTQAVKAFRADGVLRRDLSEQRAVAVLWFLSGHSPYRALVSEHGLSVDEFEQWTAETLYDQLFRPQ